jgi:hypothetical protein
MDRFQLAIANDASQELVTVHGPLMAMLAGGTLASGTQPGVEVRDIGVATVNLLMNRTIERGRSIGAGFRAREESAHAAELLREHLRSIPST